MLNTPIGQAGRVGQTGLGAIYLVANTYYHDENRYSSVNVEICEKFYDCGHKLWLMAIVNGGLRHGFADDADAQFFGNLQAQIAGVFFADNQGDAHAGSLDEHFQ